MDDSRSSERDEKPANIFYIPDCEDVILERLEYKKVFDEVKNFDSGQLVLESTNPEFYNFLKNAFLLLEEDQSYINFCLELDLDEYSIEKYKMADFLKACAQRRNQTVKTRPQQKTTSRVTFNMQKNHTRYFLTERLPSKHGNYLKADGREGQILKNEKWINPTQINQVTPWKLRSVEYENLKNRTVLSIESGHIAEGNGTRGLENTTQEICLTNLDIKNDMRSFQRYVHIPSGKKFEANDRKSRILQNKPKLFKEILKISNFQ